MSISKKAIIAFISGCLGGVAVNTFNLLFGFLNLPRLVGFDFMPDFNLIDLLSDLGWGGLWGLLFLVPFLDGMITLKGILIGALSFCVQMLVAISYIHHHPVGLMDPLPLIAYLFGLNAFWGIVSSLSWNSWKDFA